MLRPPTRPPPDRLESTSQPLLPTMMNTRLIDDISERINAFLRNTPAADMQKNLKAALTQAFTRIDLVTREEFDIQSQVLARTREKLTQLEARVADLERHNSAG